MIMKWKRTLAFLLTLSMLLVVNCGFTVVETTRDELFAEDLKGYEIYFRDRERDVVKEMFIVTKKSGDEGHGT
jgi:hypothetical protein